MAKCIRCEWDLMPWEGWCLKCGQPAEWKPQGTQRMDTTQSHVYAQTLADRLGKLPTQGAPPTSPSPAAPAPAPSLATLAQEVVDLMARGQLVVMRSAPDHRALMERI